MVVVALAVGGLAACSSGGGGADNACDMLTTEEADELLGTPTDGPSEDTDRSSGTYCEWVSTDSDDDGDAASDDGEGEPSYFISVVNDRGESAVQDFEGGKTSDFEDDDEFSVEPVSGLGDDAYFEDPHGLQVRTGDRVFSTFVSGNDLHPLTDEESKEIERRAADVIIDRIGESEGGEDVEDALECGRTKRCSGTRFRTCDLLEDAEVASITGFEVTDVEGTTIRVESENGGLCSYQLENPNPPNPNIRDRRAVEMFVEPDADAAEQEFRQVQDDFGSEAIDLPDLGDEAFYGQFGTRVYVLADGKFLSIWYAAELPSGADDTSAAIQQGAIALAEAAAPRLES